MGFEVVDRYLLGEPVSKPEAIAALLAERSPAPAAAPFYRAFEAVGVRAADEAFIALRLILAGKAHDDESVRRLRAFASVARAGRAGDRAGLAAALKRDAGILAELGKRSPDIQGSEAALVAAATEAYRLELA
jgi:hypothetical protein